ncbi:methyl-accepting chemotaxis protein [Neoaquamicrobium sediminum]|uniref:HAMP domain-containing methyl-accepting chemotaxis protein n=1 Tax=Neoaquamicrobium sediminum TaxID=1849104 RepID=A0ABV3WPA9_9HYPH
MPGTASVIGCRSEGSTMNLFAFRISHRIALIALVGVVGVLAVAGLLVYERSLISQIDATASQANQAAAVTSELQIGLLELRRNEKDFFLSRDEKYVEMHAARSGEVARSLETIEAIIARNQQRDLPGEGVLTQGYQRYLQAFGEAVEVTRRLGVSAEKGLQSELRAATGFLSEQLARIPYPALKVDVAQIFNREKDFVVTPSEQNRARVAEAIDTLRSRPGGVFGSSSGHTAVMATLDAYEATFKDFADASARSQELDAEVSESFSAIEPVFDRIRAEIENVRGEVSAARINATTSIERMVMVAVGGVLLAVLASGFLVWRSVALPISRTARSMRALASGELDVEIPGLGRRDEIGEIADAFQLFRENTIRKVNEERDAAEARQREAREREELERDEKERQARELQHAVDVLADGLSRLADGDVAQRIDEPFTASMERLRADFNNSVARLQAALQTVGENANAIHAGSDEIRNASDDLSKRTEQQAASVEQTAAALEQLVTTVRDSSRRAEEAGALVARTRTGAERSGAIVQDAVAAMDRIEASSTQISTINGVIDEIAFQISLLALNAGIEAARAGEAGRGFAVVAQEVRDLAQRAANAAKEINTLITTSGEHVRAGVELVGEAGEALRTIVSEVQEISTNVVAIVEASREQATGLNEINIAVNRIDQGTQQNAAMVEQSTAASHKLASEASALNALLAQFKLGREAPASSLREPTSAPRSPTAGIRAVGQRLAVAFRGGSGAAVAQAITPADEAGWEEF